MKVMDENIALWPITLSAAEGNVLMTQNYCIHLYLFFFFKLKFVQKISKKLKVLPLVTWFWEFYPPQYSESLSIEFFVAH